MLFWEKRSELSSPWETWYHGGCSMTFMRHDKKLLFISPTILGREKLLYIYYGNNKNELAWKLSQKNKRVKIMFSRRFYWLFSQTWYFWNHVHLPWTVNRVNRMNRVRRSHFVWMLKIIQFCKPFSLESKTSTAGGEICVSLQVCFQRWWHKYSFVILNMQYYAHRIVGIINLF